MKQMVDIMESAVREAMTGNIDMCGIIEPTAGKINKAAQKEALG